MLGEVPPDSALDMLMAELDAEPIAVWPTRYFLLTPSPAVTPSLADLEVLFDEIDPPSDKWWTL
jgi:hypothetical protein